MSENNILKEEKKRKLSALLEKGLNPYPHQFKKTDNLKDIQKKYGYLKAGESAVDVLQTAGRLMLKRAMGKAVFFNIQDQDSTLQCYLKTQEMDLDSLDFFFLRGYRGHSGFRGSALSDPKRRADFAL